MARSTEGFQGFIIRDSLADEYDVGPLFELFGTCKCPICGALHIQGGLAGVGMENPKEASEHIYNMEYYFEIECQKCEFDEERLFGKKCVEEFFRDDEPDFLRDTMIEINTGISHIYSGIWTGPGNA